MSDLEERDCELVAENLRDIGRCCGIACNRIFRSSQFHSSQTRQLHGIASVLDLRQEPRPCKQRSRVLQELYRPHWWLARAKSAGYDAFGSHALASCPNCEVLMNSETEEKSIKV
jgi:hypothetical protein